MHYKHMLFVTCIAVPIKELIAMTQQQPCGELLSGFNASHILQRQLRVAQSLQLDCSLFTYLILCMSISSGLVWPRSIAFRSADVSLKICPLLLSTSSRTDDAVATMCCILTPNCSRVARAVRVAVADGRWMMADVPGCCAVDVPCLRLPWVTSNCVCWQ